MNEQEFAELAAGHALNALSLDDERVYRETLAAHPEWTKHTATEIDTAALLSEPIASVTPPPAIRAALLTRIATMTQDPDAADTAPAAPAAVAPAIATAPAESAPVVAKKGPRRWYVLAASVAVVAALGIGTVVVTQQVDRPASLIALEQIEDAPDAQSASVELEDGAEATAHWSASRGEAVLVSEDLPVLAEDQSYELWFVRGEAPISAGVFTTEQGDATALLEGGFQPGDVIAVTVEPAGGSPSGSPTSDPILAIATA